MVVDLRVQLSLITMLSDNQFVYVEIERMKQRSETNLRAYSARDKMQEAEAKASVSILKGAVCDCDGVSISRIQCVVCDTLFK